ncbi:MAG: AmmeMemoRadiSam system protein B [Candidatus Hadarchaeales archaeon]
MRPPAVAGAFYEGSRDGLLRQIEWCYRHEHGPGEIPSIVQGSRRLVALVSPHAGYMYSGPVAAHGFSELAGDGRPGSIVVIGPNHTGMGSGVAVSISGRWKTPLGAVELDEALGRRIMAKSDIFDVDDGAHLHEHSIEVQLPFLQHLFGELKIVPICMMMQDPETAREVGEAIAGGASGTDVFIIASSDFTHYEPRDSAHAKDRAVIEKILELDPDGMMDVVEEKNVTMCGPGPVYAALWAAKRLGAKRAKLLKYATSGDTGPPMEEVVGYASISIRR